MSATHLGAEAARLRAEEALRRLWPDWSGDLEPLKPLTKPLRATPFRVTGAPQLAVIKVWGPGNARAATAQAARQNTVARQMAEGDFRAPKVFGFDEQACALIMQEVSGTELGAALEQANTQKASALMIRAGRWLAALHTPSLRTAPFRPKGHAAWLAKLVEQVEDGQRTPPEPDAFCQAAEDLIAAAPALRGLPSRRAVTHKDMSLSNLLVDDHGRLWGIDFENAAEDEPLRDVFALAVQAMPLGVPVQALGAGYGNDVTDPQVRLFLQRVFALGLWARTPAQPSRRQAQLWAAAREILATPEPMI